MQKIIKIKVLKIFFLAFLLFAIGSTNAQIGIGIANPHPSAQLDVSSTTKGFLPPRMTQAQRSAIVNPAPGLMIWCTDCGLKGEIQVHNGISWTKMTGREGENYYVKEKAHGGDDSKDGLTPENAWETIGKVNDEMKKGNISPGDSILFERGSYFFGTIIMKRSGTAASPIVFGAYGKGPKPVFIAAEQIWPIYGKTPPSPGWKTLGNHIYEYKDDLSFVDVANLVFTKDHKTSFGIKLFSPDSSKLNSQGQFWYSFYSQKILLYSEIDPRFFYDTIQSVMNVNAIEFSEYINNTIFVHSYIVFENLDFRYYGKYVVETGGSNCSYRNLDISYIGGGDQHIPGYPIPAPYTFRQGNGLQMWQGTHDVTINGCRIDNCYDAGISPQGYSKEFYGGGTCFNIFIRNNVISNCEYSFEFYERDNTQTAHDIYFENNTCINAGGGWSHNQRPDGPRGSQMRLTLFTAPKSNIFIRNNIFYNATERLVWLETAFDVSNMRLDYNDYYQSGVGFIGTINKPQPNTKNNYSDWDEWRASISQEAHSLHKDPLFISSTNFGLTAQSPVINMGTNVGFPFIGSAPDMGAYEYNPK